MHTFVILATAIDTDMVAKASSGNILVWYLPLQVCEGAGTRLSRYQKINGNNNKMNSAKRGESRPINESHLHSSLQLHLL